MDLFDHADDDAAVAAALARSGASLAKILDPSYTLSASGERPQPANVEDYYKDSLFEGDPSQPLKDSTEEQFCAVYVATHQAAVAYMRSYSAKCSIQTAKQQASRRLKVPRIQARVNWLRREKLGMDASRGGPGDGKRGAGDGGSLSIEEKMKILEVVVRDTSALPVDRLRAIESHNKLVQGMGDGKGSKKLAEMDPTEVCNYFREAEEQGVDVRLAGRQVPDQAKTGDVAPVVPGAAEVTGEGTEPQPVVGQETITGGQSEIAKVS